MFRTRQFSVLILFLLLSQTVVVSKLFAGLVDNRSNESVDRPALKEHSYLHKNLLPITQSKGPLDSNKTEMGRSIQDLDTLSTFITEKYKEEFHDAQDVSSFILFSRSLERDKPWLYPILGDSDPNLNNNAVMIENGALGSVETIRMFEHINEAIDRDLLVEGTAQRLKLLFEQTDVLVISLYFIHWPMDRICYNLSLDSIEKFISFFPNVKTIYLDLRCLSDAFRLPIPSNIQNLQKLYLRLIEGFKNVPNEEDTRNWYQNWPVDLLGVIERNLHLTTLSLYTPGTKRDFLEKLKNNIRKLPDLSNLTLFNPKSGGRSFDPFNYREKDLVYLEMYKNILAETPQLSEIRCFHGMGLITSLDQSELDKMISEAQEHSIAEAQDLKSEDTFFGAKVKKIWNCLKKTAGIAP